MGRSHAWIRKGYELIDPRPMNWGTNLTMIGALRLRGWVTGSSHFKAANGDSFARWLRRRLLPKLAPGDVIVLDNARLHHDPRVRPLVERAGLQLEYLPPYSPDLNPIEPAWSIVKKVLRAAAPRTAQALRRVAQYAPRRVRRGHCLEWFRHAGYDHRFK
jgi:transposase